jgi:protein-disulfide isomerase
MSKDRIRQRRVESLKRSIWVTTGVAVLAAALLIAMNPRALPSVTIPPTVDRPYAGQGRTLGPENAPVLIEEYSDFQCPYCAQFALQTLPQLEDTYIAGGQVRFVSHYFAFIGDESIRAAEAVECANEQGRVWDYMDTLWVNQHGENRGAFADSYLKSFADGLGLNTLEFGTCLDTRRYRATVTQETNEGRNRGVTSTPTFFINGKMVPGAKPFEGFQQEIEAALAGGG